MGIGKSGLSFLANAVKFAFSDTKNLRMVELGDQKIHPDICLKPSGERMWAKDLFERAGFHHYSIDWHGRNGAHPLDLSKPIEDKFWLGRFDILTNFGTAEHVENQYECWRNVHNLVRPGGLFIHFLPMVWPARHCKYFYSPKFVFNLAKANDYKFIVFESRKGHLLSGLKQTTIHLSMLKPKQSRAFSPDEKEFVSWM